MRIGQRGDPIQLWIGAAALSGLAATTAAGFMLAVSGAAAIVCLVIFVVFGLLTLVLVYCTFAVHYGWPPFSETRPELRIRGGNTDEYRRMDVTTEYEAEFAKFGAPPTRGEEPPPSLFVYTTLLMIENVGDAVARNPVVRVAGTNPLCRAGIPQPLLSWYEDADIPPTGKGFAALSRFFTGMEEKGFGFLDAQSSMWMTTAVGQPIELEIEAWCDGLAQPERARFTVHGFIVDKYLSVTPSEHAPEG